MKALLFALCMIISSACFAAHTGHGGGSSVVIDNYISKRLAFITLAQAATKSATNFSCASAEP